MKSTIVSISEALMQGEKLLEISNIDSPRKHAELLLEKVTQQDRVALYLNASREVNEHESLEYSQLIYRRCEGEPIQYIIGKSPFYGREFRVGSGVFIPRFDSEALIDRLMKAHRERRVSGEQIEVLDLCCGSGILGLTALLEIPNSRATLADISQIAIDFTTINAKHFGIENQVDIVQRDVLKEFPDTWQEKYDYILANPPYIHANDLDLLDAEVRLEPHEALSDGGNGLSFYQSWSSRIKGLLKPDGRFFCEIDSNISRLIDKLLTEYFGEVRISKDISGNIRVCEATKN